MPLHLYCQQLYVTCKFQNTDKDFCTVRFTSVPISVHYTINLKHYNNEMVKIIRAYHPNTSFYITGMVIGGFVWGVIADCLGRRKTLILILGLTTASEIVSAFTLTYWSLFFSKLCTGFT